MTAYTKSTNFATKDTLTSGDPLKIVKGTEINTEFDNIATAVNSKSDTASPTFTGTVTIPILAVTGASTLSHYDLCSKPIYKKNHCLGILCIEQRILFYQLTNHHYVLNKKILAVLSPKL